MHACWFIYVRHYCYLEWNSGLSVFCTYQEIVLWIQSLCRTSQKLIPLLLIPHRRTLPLLSSAHYPIHTSEDHNRPQDRPRIIHILACNRDLGGKRQEDGHVDCKRDREEVDGETPAAHVKHTGGNVLRGAEALDH